jgi:nitrate/nitrite transport system substrate-binding protein
LLDETPDYDAIADGVLLRSLYEEVAAAEGIDVPDDDMAPFDVELDDVTFDPNAPDEEAQRS